MVSRADKQQMMYTAWNAITPTSEALFKEFTGQLQLASYEKGHTLLAAGQKSEISYFLLSGIIRFYYTTEDGKEFNKAFYSEQQLVGSLSSIILSEPSRYSIEALEPCEGFVIPNSLYLHYVTKDLAWERHFSYCCQMMLVRNERREAELLLKSPKERYLQFARNFPELLKRVPQYHIASYLGITPVALSRSRANWEQAL